MNKKQSLVQKLFLCTFFSLASTKVHAQITPDNTLGAEASKLVPNVLMNGASADLVNGGAQRGNNLFHSFSDFNISNGQRVYFGNPSGVVNILTRITGGNASNILGTLGVDGNANLFLINPNGILFGQKASLDVRGSFVGTTANGVQFGNQGNFSATNPEVPGLLTINPSALFFNQINSNAAIVNNSVASAGIDPAGFDAFGLRVSDGKSLLLVGGNVNMNGGQLNAYGGKVELGGLKEPGNINLFFNANNLRLGFSEDVTRATVSLRNQASVYVEASGGGDITVNAQNIEILEGGRLITGIGEGLGAPLTIAGDITLNATGEIKVAAGSRIDNLVRLGSKGNGGNITINADSFKLEDNARLTASTYGIGNAGNVTVTAKGALTLTNANIFSSVEAGGLGKGGNIDLVAATLLLQDGAQIQAITREASGAQQAGRGDAGNVNILVTGVVDIAGKKDIFPSSINSVVETGTIGNAGNITIDAASLKLRSGAGGLATSTSGQGNAGNITVRAKNDVSLINGDIFSTVEAGGIGNGGNIGINASSLSLQEGAQLLTFVREASDTQAAGQGNAGSINVRVTGDVDIYGEINGFKSGIRSLVAPLTVGNGGNITIDSGSFSLRDGARLNASTAGIGNAGSININTTGAVTISGDQDGNVSAIFADVVGAKGSGGNININSATFSLLDGTQLITSTSGIGDAGNVNVNAFGAVLLADNSSIISTVGAGGVGSGGDINIKAATLSIIDGAQLQANTFGASATQEAGRGSAGNVNLKVTGLINIRGVKNGFKSAIGSLVETGTEGRSGNITIDAGSFKLQDGAALDARTNNNDRGGDITVNTNVFKVLTGGQLTTTTSSNGRAGKITVNALEKVIVSGSDPNYNGQVANFPSDILNIGANAGFFVNSTGAGTTGDIEINSPNITLDNQGKLQANSASGNGGNINLKNNNLLLLRRGAQISTNAGTAQQGGDGGNIDINSRFIVAVPTENSDITANAFTGRGGNVNIRAQGIFGIEPRATESPQTSDITASSQRGVQGEISITEPDVQPAQGLIELPEEVVDATRRVAQICPREPGAKPLGEFIITGRGSLPPSPLEPLSGATNTTKLATLDNNNTNVSNTAPKKVQNAIVEAQGWVKNNDGSLELVATAPQTAPEARTSVAVCPS